jgi:Holliday junction resolvase
MGKQQRTKGHNYEREIVRKFKATGFNNAYRVIESQQSHHRGHNHNGVDVIAGNLRIQCKRYKGYAPIGKIREVQSDGIPVLVTKADYKDSMVVLSLEDFLAILGDVGGGI